MRIDPRDVEALFRDAGAFLEGHFALASGRHSPRCAAGATVVGAAVLVKRSDGRVDVPLHALWEVTMQTYEPADCPQCRAGVPLAHPGTTPASLADGGTTPASRRGSGAAPSPAVAR